MSRTFGLLGVSALLCFFLAPGDVQAQTSEIPVELDDTETYGIGARAVAMGLAQQGVTFDPLALVGNPAALAFLPDLHLSGSFSIRSIKAALERGARVENSLSRVDFDHVIFAFPVSPEVTLAVGSYVITEPSRKLPYVGPVDSEFGQVEVDAVDVEGAVRAWSVGGGWAVTPRFSLGGRFEVLDGYRDETLIVAHGLPTNSFDADEFGLCYSCGGSQTTFREDTMRELDLTGYRGAVSAFGFVGENIRLGTTLDFPTSLEYTGNILIQYQDFVGPFDDESVYIVDRITLPLRFAFGGAWENRALTVAADARFSDWEQIDFEGEILGPGRRPAYRSTFDIHVGGEYRLQTQPVALRAGVMFTPLPYRYLAGDTELIFDANDPQDGSDDISYVGRYYPEATITTDRTAVSLGMGVQVTPGFSLDFAFQASQWKRQAENGSTRETRNTSRVILSGGYRW